MSTIERMSSIQAVRDTLQSWMTTEFMWDGRPIGNLATEIRLDFPWVDNVTVWSNPTPALWPRFTRHAKLDIEDWYEKVDWDRFAAAFRTDGKFRLTGRLLHPVTSDLIDADTLARENAELVVRVVDRNTPGKAPAIDPTGTTTVVPHEGTINAGWLTQEHDWSWDAAAAGTTCLTLAALAAHEALEMYQSSPGVPVVNPHEHSIRCAVDFPDHTTLTTLI